MIGKTVSHYRIIDKIGQGGMGVVYRAEDTTLHRTVALKFLPSHLAGSDQDMARFINEARTAASLSHPNICTIYEIDEKAELPFISMAYIEGKNLDDIVAGGPLEMEDALRYATQVARGLEEAHTRGVIHRDIKSANIVVSEKGHAIVMDFGLAKLHGQTRITQTGTTVGTVSYMSPEQARGAEVDHRSDIWSLGVVLYRMITGRYPFEGAHPAAVMYAVMHDSYPPPGAVRAGVPSDLETIVDRALAKDLTARYQSVSDMLLDLKAVRDGLGLAKSDTARPRPMKSRRSRTPWLFAGLAVVVVAGSFLAWQHFAGGRGGAGTEHVTAGDDRVSIAVLPLDNMSPDANQEYVADGMTEALIAELAQIRALRVISRTSVMRFKGTTQTIPEIAAMLGVSTIIEGSVVQANGRVRVTAQLIDAQKDEHLWAQSYERDMSDVLALQAEVARAIAHEVKVELTPDENERLASAKPVDPAAYDLYLRGRHHWNLRTQSDLERALELFKQAVDIQPDYAMGYAALAQTYVVMLNWGAIPPREANESAREMVQKALAIDPNLSAAWASLAGVATDWDWDWTKAETYYRKAIELEPNNATTHQWYAEFLTSQGRFDEALEQIELAGQLDPLSRVAKLVHSFVFLISGKFDLAIAGYERLIETEPDFVGAYNYLGDAYRHGGQPDRAAEAYARYYESVSPGAGDVLRQKYAEGGMDALVRATINGMKQTSGTRYVSPTFIGFYFASIGEADSAMTWLDRAYRDRAYPLSLSAVALYCEPIHNDPRFIDLLRRMKLDHVVPSYAKK